MILLGEHAVGYGEPAIATPIGLRLTLTTTLNDRTLKDGGPSTRPTDPSVRTAVDTAATLFALAPHQVTTEVESGIPPGCGLGSSAAFTVALLRTLADLTDRHPGQDELLDQARAVEAAFHGTSSGLDDAAVGLGATIWFQRTPRPHAAPLPVREAFDLVIAITRERRSTARQVDLLRRRAQLHPDLFRRHFTHLGGLTRVGRDALGTGDLAALGRLLDEAQGVLAGMGLSTPALDHAIATARSAGALGAKLTGAGGGGAVIALVPGGASAVVADALRSDGHETFVSRVAATGPRADRPPLQDVSATAGCGPRGA
ncbi:mevalonate kinase [Kitasatospora brasiliensis]|uniref:mevalonate kinase n=1 Tax=Kitasatospora brasiliensis TaxID=3058040 RepID=UPI00292F5D0F|nr:mevalonate kinase [Kitasatospora sp. K002]